MALFLEIFALYLELIKINLNIKILKLKFKQSLLFLLLGLNGGVEFFNSGGIAGFELAAGLVGNTFLALVCDADFAFALLLFASFDDCFNFPADFDDLFIDFGA